MKAGKSHHLTAHRERKTPPQWSPAMKAGKRSQ